MIKGSSFHKPLKFGICDYQVKPVSGRFSDTDFGPSVVMMCYLWLQIGSEFAQKNYSSGSRLLTAFPDGSAQLLYPLLITATRNFSVCSGCSMAAASVVNLINYTSVILQVLLQLLSWIQKILEGCALCMMIAVPPVRQPEPYSTPMAGQYVFTATETYGKTSTTLAKTTVARILSMWMICCRLNLSKSVGRCLEEDGSRLRQWTWSGLGRVPTVLDPIYLNLNKKVKLQILGREHVFISFQACGEDVKFSVGRYSC